MTQAERDRLVALKKAKKKLITQKQAAEELGVTERQVRRLLRGMKKRGDKAVVHALRGVPSNRRISADTRKEAQLPPMGKCRRVLRSCVSGRRESFMRTKKRNSAPESSAACVLQMIFRLTTESQHSANCCSWVSAAILAP